MYSLNAILFPLSPSSSSSSAVVFSRVEHYADQLIGTFASLTAVTCETQEMQGFILAKIINNRVELRDTKVMGYLEFGILI